ncbi:MAG: hypothetical protein WBM46_12790 [Polyangiales bacterium]
MALTAAFLALIAGCAFETHSLGSGHGGVDGQGLGGAGGSDAGLGLSGAGGAGGLGGPGVVELPECTPATERTDCPATSCNPRTMRCSTFKLASRPTCWTCVSDNDCEAPDHRCVEMSHGGKRFPDEYTGFCLRLAVPESDGDYDCDEPYETVLVDRPSLSFGLTQSYCGIREDLTTCYAVRAFENQEACPDGTDEECPEGGLCRTFGSGRSTVNHCTFECTSDDECPPLDGSPTTCRDFCGG